MIKFNYFREMTAAATAMANAIIRNLVCGVMVLFFAAMLILACLFPVLIAGTAAYWAVQILRWAATL